MPCPTN